MLQGGVKIVLSALAANEQRLIAVGYRYSSKKTLFLIMTLKAGSMKAGTP
jgi:hypothetical protein